MAELERLANHFGDIGAICNDASFSLMHAQCGILRERVLRAARCLLRPSADDGSRRAGRRRRAISPRDGACAVRALLAEIAGALSATDRALRQHRLAAGPHRRPPASCSRRSRGSSAPAAMSAAPRAAASTRAACPAMRPTTGSHFDVPVLDGGRRQCARLDPHPRGRAEPVADRRRSSSGCRTARSKPSVTASGARREGIGAGRGLPRRRSRLAALDGDGRVARCHLRDPRGSSGRCWKRRSRATSSPTSRSATNRSTAPIPGTICRTCACARFCSKA